MSCLNRDIIFAIGKKLVEDGDPVAIMKFALSGKKQLYEMRNVFASVTFLDLNEGFYGIGWGRKSGKFYYQNGEELPLKFFMDCIGDSVINLHLNFSHIRRTMYQPFIEKIVENHKLVKFSLSAETLMQQTFLDEFLPQFAATLKHVSIPSSCMTPKFRDSLDLESLTILDQFDFELPLFCCKTTSLTLADKNNPYPNGSYNDFVAKYPILNPGLTSIKRICFKLDFYDYEICRILFTDLINYFPSVELIQFTFPLIIKNFVLNYIQFYTYVIQKSIKVPPKVVIDFWKVGETIDWFDLDGWKEVCVDFELDESLANFYCFRKSIQSGGDESAVLEVQIPK
uniref:DUF38 domain-containing protein n=1 Tax=Panagrolaimus sp. PS1159 TaxID=55785 RepID=A0AC35FFW2_9BILA